MAELRILSRIIMRVKKGDLPVAFNGRTFDDLMDRKLLFIISIHSDLDARDIVLSELSTTLIYFALIKYMGAENVPSQHEVISFYGKVTLYKFYKKSF